MSFVTTECQCCHEDMGAIADYDPDLGGICPDCAKGKFDGLAILHSEGCAGVYRGICGDNQSEP